MLIKIELEGGTNRFLLESGDYLLLESSGRRNWSRRVEDIFLPRELPLRVTIHNLPREVGFGTL